MIYCRKAHLPPGPPKVQACSLHRFSENLVLEKCFPGIFTWSLIRKTSQDPLFQKMAALYEHIGDLVALGDADATTKAYQEAGSQEI